MKKTYLFAALGFVCLIVILTVLLSLFSSSSKPGNIFTDIKDEITSSTSGSASASSASATYKGAYLLTSRISAGKDDPIDTTLFSVPYIDGISMHVSWDAIEPSAGTYAWDKFDTLVDAAVKNDKKITMAVTAGEYAPTWLYTQKGVPSLTFSKANNSGKACSSIIEPVFWNAEYQRQYASMMQAVAAHLKERNAYDLVRFVKITGMNENADELHLTNNTIHKNGLPCETDGQAVWQKAGYRPSIAIASWTAFANAVTAAFPDKYYGLSINGNAFPYINEAGAIEQGTSPTYKDPGDTIVANALAKYGARFGLITDSLSVSKWDDKEMRVESVADRGGIAMYQTNLYGGAEDGAQCGDDQRHGDKGTEVKCTPELYGKILTHGLDHKGTYFELWPQDVKDFPGPIADLQSKLKQ